MEDENKYINTAKIQTPKHDLSKKSFTLTSIHIFIYSVKRNFTNQSLPSDAHGKIQVPS
jgi:hypothetical protein